MKVISILATLAGVCAALPQDSVSSASASSVTSTKTSSTSTSTIPYPTTIAHATVGPSSKRGLVYVPSAQHPTDDNIWVLNGSDISWYYTYGFTPVNAFKGKMEFVPMLWGLPVNGDTSFYENVAAMKKAGQNITHVLGFNEPDGTSATGGSDIDATAAAKAWIQIMEPLRTNFGIKLGAPSVTGSPSGFTWMQDFFTACNGSCHVDFMPIHWYDNFAGLASHMAQYRTAYPTIPQWVTEYALANQDLASTQSFFNMSASWFDNTDWVERYSYFGSFRSSVSNVGPNVPMLDANGKLTTIGSEYTQLAVGTTTSSSAAPKFIMSRLLLATVLVLLASCLLF